MARHRKSELINKREKSWKLDLDFNFGSVEKCHYLVLILEG